MHAFFICFLRHKAVDGAVYEGTYFRNVSLAQDGRVDGIVSPCAERLVEFSLHPAKSSGRMGLHRGVDFHEQLYRLQKSEVSLSD